MIGKGILSFSLSGLLAYGITLYGAHVGLWVLPYYAGELIAGLGCLVSILYLYLVSIQRRHAHSFILFYMASQAVKIICGIVLLWYFAYLNPSQALPNAVILILAYIWFSFIEVHFLYRLIRGSK